MGRIKLGLAAVAGIVGVLAVAGSMGWQWWLGQGRPQREGEAGLRGLEAPVVVRFDRWGVPHVRASSSRDLAAAMGWLHANDRMTQLELGRRAARGRLSEVFGEATLTLDEESRTLRLGEIAAMLVESAGPESLEWLHGYADGVNAWLSGRDGDLPPTLILFGVDPEPWTPADSLAFAVLMNRELSFWQGRPEELRFRWLRDLGPERTFDLLGARPHLAPEMANLALSGGPTRAGASPDDLGGPLGSNNWALGPSRTTGGRALVAGDPHLPLQLPSVWYQASLEAPSYRAAGMTLTGLPGVVIGQSRDLAWSLTNVMMDDHDLLFERLSDDGARVRRGEVWTEVETTVEEIRVRGAEPYAVRLAATDLGPLLPPDPGLGLPPRTLLWTGYEPGDPLRALIHVARAERVEEVPGGIAGFIGPAQNLVVADRHGDLMVTILGRIPDRKRGDGVLPTPGWTVGGGWSGLRPADTNPRVLRPPEDLIVTANARVFGPESGESFAAEYDLPTRQERIERLIAAGSEWTTGGLVAVQTDIVDEYALEVVRRLGEGHRGDGARARQLLADWNGEMGDLPPAALFVALEQSLAEIAFGDELDLDAVPGQTKRTWLLRLMRGEMDEGWFDWLPTPVRENRPAAIQLALEQAYQRQSAPSYGPIHRLDLRHPLGRLPLIGGFFDHRRLKMAGSATTVAAFGGPWRGTDRPVTYGPSMRWIAVPGLGDEALAVVPGGQSGHPADPHYDDQLPLFLAGELRPATWTDEAIEAATTSQLRLVP